MQCVDGGRREQDHAVDGLRFPRCGVGGCAGTHAPAKDADGLGSGLPESQDRSKDIFAKCPWIPVGGGLAISPEVDGQDQETRVGKLDSQGAPARPVEDRAVGKKDTSRAASPEIAVDRDAIGGLEVDGPGLVVAFGRGRGQDWQRGSCQKKQYRSVHRDSPYNGRWDGSIYTISGDWPCVHCMT